MSKSLTYQQANQRFNQFARVPVRYTFHVRLEKGNHYQGVASYNFDLAHVDTDTFLDFTGKAVVAVIINSQALEKIDFDGSFVTLPKSHLKVGPNTLVVVFKNEYNNDGNGCVSFIDVDGKQYIYTQFEPYYANRVFPLFDQPDLKGTMVLNIVAPSVWKVLSNEKPTVTSKFSWAEYSAATHSADEKHIKELLDGVAEDNTMTLHPATKILPNYLFCFVAGEYSELQCPNPYKGLPMSLYCIESLIEHLKTLAPFIWEVTIESMKFFEEFFGYPFSFNKYQQVFAHEYKWGAMENAGIVTFNDLYVWKEKVSNERMLGLANTISHELAHHWFGNLVTMKWWDDLWLNESFADYISHFCLEKIKTKITTLHYDSSMTSFNNRKGWGYHEDQLTTTHSISGPVANTQVAESIFDGITYSKGAATMKQLLFLMGEDNFSKALSEYFKKYEWSNTILPNFIECMQNHFHNNKFTLEQWKNVWLEKACLNEIEPVWDCSCKSPNTKLLIKQAPVLQEHPTLRMHKIKVGLFSEDCSVDVLDVWVDPQSETVVEFDSTKGYKALLLNFEDHSFVKHVIDHTSRQFFAKNLCKIPDLLSRCLIWNSFYTMVKDSKVTSNTFIDVFVNNIEHESYDGIFERQFDLVSASINTYTPKKYRDALNTKVFHFILEMIHRVPADKANRLIVLRNKLVEFAHVPEDKKILISWRSNTFEQLKDHKMTIGQQWSTVVKAFTLPDWSVEQKEQLFADQLKLDSSDTSKAKRQTCDALIATKEKFEELYNSYRNKVGDLSSTLRRASMAGWNHWVHIDWVTEYKKRYFGDVLEVSDKYDADYALLFLEYLQPVGDDLQGDIHQYEELIKKLDKHDRVKIETKKIVDDLKRRAKAYALYESTHASKL